MWVRGGEAELDAWCGMVEDKRGVGVVGVGW